MDNFNYIQNLLDKSGHKLDGGNNSSLGDIRFFKLPANRTERGALAETVIRVLPFDINNSDFPFKVVLKHYAIPNAARGVTCLKTWMLDCPICNVLNSLSRNMDISVYTSRLRPVCNALILRCSSNNNVNPMLANVLTITPNLLNSFAEFWRDPSKRTIFDVMSGRNVTLLRSRDKGPFNLTVDFERSPIAPSEEGLRSVMSTLYDLNKIWKNPDDNQVNQIADLAANFEESLRNRSSLLDGGTNFNQPPKQQFNQQPRQQFNQQPRQQFNQPPAQQFNQQPRQQFNQQPRQQFNQPPMQQFNQAQQEEFVTDDGTKIEYVTEDFLAVSDKSDNLEMVGTPNCFGDSKVYNKDSEGCISCNFEFQCAKKISTKNI